MSNFLQIKTKNKLQSLLSNNDSEYINKVLSSDKDEIKNLDFFFSKKRKKVIIFLKW